jgi:site-specific recombinase XerD
VTTADLASLGRTIESESLGNGGIGAGALASFTHASRFFYRVAVNDGVLAVNPAMALSMPNRRRRVRRALTEHELRDVYQTVMATSSDVALDLLLLDFHRETAARRGGAIALRVMDVNAVRGSLILREKGGHEREVPASRDLVRRMVQHAEERAARVSSDQVFRYKNGAPLSRRRYNTIFDHVQAALPWAARLGVSAHFLRHTTLSDISAVAGIRVAAAYAGHAPSSVTDIYTVPTFEDLARAHALVFGHL